MKAGDSISYKVGTPASKDWDTAVAEATALLTQTGDEVGLTPRITSAEKLQTEAHEEAGEYLVVLRGVWESADE